MTKEELLVIEQKYQEYLKATYEIGSCECCLAEELIEVDMPNLIESLREKEGELYE